MRRFLLAGETLRFAGSGLSLTLKLAFSLCNRCPIRVMITSNLRGPQSFLTICLAFAISRGAAGIQPKDEAKSLI